MGYFELNSFKNIGVTREYELGKITYPGKFTHPRDSRPGSRNHMFSSLSALGKLQFNSGIPHFCQMHILFVSHILNKADYITGPPWQV